MTTPVSRIFDLLDYQAVNYPKPDALVAKQAGQWISTSTKDFQAEANLVSLGLLALGIQAGDKVATISNNRSEWNFVDFGILQIGAVHVPIYPTISDNDYRFILNDAEVRLVFVSDASLFKRIQSILPEVASIREVYSFDKVDGAKHWRIISELGRAQADQELLTKTKANIQEGDLATIIYTSGTSGTPKGVMLSHRNIVTNFVSCKDLPHVGKEHRALSFLPLCHSYERMLTYLYIYLGVSIYYAESIDKIGDNLKEIKPHLFSTVPRLLEKVYDKIVAKGSEQTGIKKKLFFWALNLGLAYDKRQGGVWFSLQLALANKIVFNKWREALGGNVICIVSGGAALQPRLASVFWAAQIQVLEGYGLTETSPVIAVNFIEKGMHKIGTVGPIIPGVTVKFGEDGEILCKGPNIMLGYYKRPDLTAEVIDAEGFFHTGDIGMLLENKFLKITDRKKEIFKTSGGKYVAPQPMENLYKESLFIEQIMVIGEGQNFPAALVVPSFQHLKQWCTEQGINTDNKEAIIQEDAVITKIRQEIAGFNKEFGKTEQVKKFELLTKEWTVESGELTPTLKLKRKVILENQKALVSKIYKD